MRESQENLIASLEEFKQQMRSVLPQLPRAPGPIDKEVVAALLDTRASRKQAVGDFGWKWAMELEDKQLLPLPAYQDRDFLNELMDQRSKASAAHSLHLTGCGLKTECFCRLSFRRFRH